MGSLTFRRSAAVCVAALLLFCSPFVLAQRAGYDLLKTGSDASIDLSSIPGVSPHVVPLKGVPICACTGGTDTIMHRSDAGPGGVAHLTIVGLFLKNSGPVMFGKTPVDVYITVNDSNGVIGQNTLPQPDAVTPSTGTLTIHPGGTFDSDFTVHADVIVVAAGANVRNPATHMAHHPAPPVHLGATGSPWSTTPPPDYPECFFPANGFYPAGPVPEQDPTTPAHRHPVVPSSPFSASLTAVPASYVGRCPGRINFNGTITATVAGDVTYTFLRSDGATAPTFTLHFAAPGTQSVHTDWTLGGIPALPHYEGWEAIKVLTPGVLESNHANFTLRCTP